MRTKALLVIVLCLGASFTMLETAGFAQAWGVDGEPEGTAVEEALENASENSSVGGSGSIQGDTSTTNGDSDIVSIILDGSQALISALGKIAVLPITMMDLGFPAWFAVPLGSFAYVVAGIGAIQFATGRVFR